MDQYTLTANTQYERRKLTEFKNKHGDKILEYLLHRERDALRLEKERKSSEFTSEFEIQETKQKHAPSDAIESLSAAVVQLCGQLMNIKIPNAIEYDEIIAKQKSDLKKITEENFNLQEKLNETSENRDRIEDLHDQSQYDLETSKKELESAKEKILDLENSVSELQAELKNTETYFSNLLSRQKGFRKSTPVKGNEYSTDQNEANQGIN